MRDAAAPAAVEIGVEDLHPGLPAGARRMTVTCLAAVIVA